MVWVRLDDRIDEHPKIARLDDHAFALFVCGLAYANRNLTDGFIPQQVGRGQLRYCDGDTAPAIGQLERVGLWEPTDGGWQVHDFPHYQPSKETVLKERAADAARKADKRQSPPRSPERNPPGTPENVQELSNQDIRRNPVPPRTRTRTVGSEYVTPQPPVRDRAADGAAPRGATPGDDPVRLPNGAQQCPMGPHLYTGDYGEHLKTHPARPEPEDFGRGKRKGKQSPPPDESPPQQVSGIPMAKLLEEHEALLAREALLHADRANA